MATEPIILVNRAKCKLCEQTVQSNSVHDYVTCVCGNLSVDGGTYYLKRGFKEQDSYIELSVYSDADFKDIRIHLCRGGRGKNGKQPLKYVPLYEIDDDWLDALIEYEQKNRPKNRFLPYYIKEKQYRCQN